MNTKRIGLLMPEELHARLMTFKEKTYEPTITHIILKAIDSYIGGYQPIEYPIIQKTVIGLDPVQKTQSQPIVVSKEEEIKKEPVDMSIPFSERMINKYFDNNFVIREDNSDETNLKIRQEYINMLDSIHKSEYSSIEKLMAVEFNDGKKDSSGNYRAQVFPTWLFEQKDWKMN